MKVPKFLCVLVQVLLLLLRSTRCHGWGTIGHEVVANVAWAALSAEARTWVTLLLSSNGTSSFPATTTIRHANDQDASNSRATTLKTIQQEDNSPLGEVADWADQVRHYLPWSAPLHYIDVRDDLLAHGCHVDPALNPQCRFLYERDCPDDTCVAGAIVNYTHQLLLPQHWNQPQSLLRGTRPFQPTIGGSKATKEALMFLTQ